MARAMTTSARRQNSVTAHLSSRSVGAKADPSICTTPTSSSLHCFVYTRDSAAPSHQPILRMDTNRSHVDMIRSEDTARPVIAAVWCS